MLKHVDSKEIKVLYLVQLYNIDPGYARAIYDLLPEKAKGGTEGFEFSEVEAAAPEAPKAGKTAKFRPSLSSERLVGEVPSTRVYNM
jgi:catalase